MAHEPYEELLDEYEEFLDEVDSIMGLIHKGCWHPNDRDVPQRLEDMIDRGRNTLIYLRGGIP